MFFGCFELRTQCPHCSGPVILNGFFRKVRCPSCEKEVKIDRDLYESVIKEFLEKYNSLQPRQGHSGTINFNFHYGAYRLDPRCQSCNEPLEVAQIEAGTEGEIECKNCGNKMTTAPTTAWVQNMFPVAVQTFGVDKPEKPEDAEAVKETEKIRPIVFSCPQCGGALKVTADRARAAACESCGSNVYLPDEIWSRFHPVDTVREWFVGFGKPTEKVKKPDPIPAEDKKRQKGK